MCQKDCTTTAMLGLQGLVTWRAILPERDAEATAAALSEVCSTFCHQVRARQPWGCCADMAGQKAVQSTSLCPCRMDRVLAASAGVCQEGPHLVKFL